MNLTENPVRQAADNRARVLGYAGIVDMLETAYGNDKPWTEVAQELGVAYVDTVAQWARSLGLKRGNSCHMFLPCTVILGNKSCGVTGEPDKEEYH